MVAAACGVADAAPVAGWVLARNVVGAGGAAIPNGSVAGAVVAIISAIEGIVTGFPIISGSRNCASMFNRIEAIC